MATTPTTPTTAAELWTIIKKEITGIQLLWEIVNGLYFQPQGNGWQSLQADAPTLTNVMQTALMESLLIRVSRMMDPAATRELKNLSLKQLVGANKNIDADEKVIRAIWDGSGLVKIRNKYLSHNDLDTSLKENHTLNIPLEKADIVALQQLVEGLRTLRRDVNLKLNGVTYVDQGLDLMVQRDIQMLGRTLLGGELFFTLLPEHELLQQALESEEQKK